MFMFVLQPYLVAKPANSDITSINSQQINDFKAQVTYFISIYRAFQKYTILFKMCVLLPKINKKVEIYRRPKIIYYRNIEGRRFIFLKSHVNQVRHKISVV